MSEIESDKIYYLIHPEEQTLEGRIFAANSQISLLELYPPEWGIRFLVANRIFSHLNSIDNKGKNILPTTIYTLPYNEGIAAFITPASLGNRVKILSGSFYEHTIDSKKDPQATLENWDYQVHHIRGSLPFSFIKPYISLNEGYYEKKITIDSHGLKINDPYSSTPKP